MKPIRERSDQDLLPLLQEGNDAAFTELYNRYLEKLLLIAWNHTKDRALAEDIVHEVFISVLKEKYPFQIVNVGGFLATKIKFVVFKNYRKEQRRNKLAENNLIFRDLTLDEEKLDALFLKEYIDGVVDSLPEKCKLTYKYSRELGLNNSEIAAQMKVTEKGVEANLTRALKIIRRSLDIIGVLSLISFDVIKMIIDK